MVKRPERIKYGTITGIQKGEHEITVSPDESRIPVILSISPKGIYLIQHGIPTIILGGSTDSFPEMWSRIAFYSSGAWAPIFPANKQKVTEQSAALAQ